jgi:CubicO group peptidase (beta-lactamase class C family)
VNVALVDGHEIVRVEGDLDEPFQAGSVSKPVAALTVIRLADSGTIALDWDVNDQLSTWRLPDGDGVTPRHLLTHTAGLGMPFCPGYPEGEPVPSLVDVLGAVGIEGTHGEFRYSGGGYALLQLLVEDVTGSSFADAAREVVLEPLGMTRSTFAQDRGHVYPEQAAAGLWTTAADLGRFVSELQRGVAGAEQMKSAQVELPADGEWAALRTLGIEPPDRFGLGLFLTGDAWFSHLGGAHAHYSGIFGSLDGEAGAVVATEGQATPAFFEALLALSDEHGWRHFRA